MDQTPTLQPQFDMEFFQSLQFPTPLGLSDTLDNNKRKLSFANFESPSLRFRPNPFDHSDLPHLDNMSFFFPLKDEDMHHNHSALHRADAGMANWQAPHVHNLLDLPLEMKEMDMGMDFQIRSRGGSFNFGRIRKESEDFFHVHSDIFKQIRNLTDRKGPMENQLRKQSQNFNIPESQSPRPGHEAHHAHFDGNFMLTPQATHGNFLHPQGGFNMQDSMPMGMMASARNTDSTVDTQDGETQENKKKSKKKRMLNDRSEEYVEEEKGNKDVVKSGKAKNGSNKKDEDPLKPKVKLQKSKSKKDTFNTKTEATEDGFRSTEISSNASKIEDSPANSKLKNSSTGDYLRLKATGNMEELLGGLNVPEDVKEYLLNSNVMGQIPWLETRKIGTLTVAERKVKIEKYLEKRKKRSWSRRINYDCRKRVADSRLRIKGRFVTRDQAFVLLNEAGIPFTDAITNDEIKALLTEKFGGVVSKKKNAEEEKNTVVHLKRPSDRDLEDEVDDNSYQYE